MFKRKKHNWTIPEGQEPTAFDKKILSYQNQGFLVPTRKLIKTPEQIEGIKQSGVINTGVLDLIEQEIHAGMTTEEIDKLVYDYTVSHGAIPAPLNYEGFPKSAPVSTKWFATAFQTTAKCWKKVILSMWMFLPYIKDTTAMRHVCLLSARPLLKKKSLYALRKNVWK